MDTLESMLTPLYPKFYNEFDTFLFPNFTIHLLHFYFSFDTFLFFLNVLMETPKSMLEPLYSQIYNE